MYKFGVFNASDECMWCGGPVSVQTYRDETCIKAFNDIAKTNNINDIIRIARTHHHRHGTCTMHVAQAGDRALRNYFFEDEPESSDTSASKVLSSVINWMVYKSESVKEQFWGVTFLYSLVWTRTVNPPTAVVSLLQVLRELVWDIRMKFKNDEDKSIIPAATRLAGVLQFMWDRRPLVTEQQILTKIYTTCPCC
jgi:hypothetical protein